MKLKNPEVRIETTNACNGSCVVCPRDKMTRPIVTMDNEHFIDLIVQAKVLEAENISPFGFGEPLMDSSIEVKLKHCRDFELKTFITTNASFLAVDLSHDLLNAGLSKIRFSMHGRGVNYELVHRCFDFVQIMRNINNFLQINDDRCVTAVTVIPMHGERIEDIRDFWEGKVDEVEIWKPHNWVYGKKYREVARKKKSCGRPHNGPIQIQSDGKVVPCCFDYDGRMILGDTHKQTLEDIIKGEKYEQLRAHHEAGIFAGLPCETCDQLNIEKESPLLYSSVDEDRKIGRTSSTKFDLEETKNGLCKKDEQEEFNSCTRR